MLTRRRLIGLSVAIGSAASAVKAFATRLPRLGIAAQVTKPADALKGKIYNKGTRGTRFIAEAPLKPFVAVTRRPLSMTRALPLIRAARFDRYEVTVGRSRRLPAEFKNHAWPRHDIMNPVRRDYCSRIASTSR